MKYTLVVSEKVSQLKVATAGKYDLTAALMSVFENDSAEQKSPWLWWKFLPL